MATKIRNTLIFRTATFSVLLFLSQCGRILPKFYPYLSNLRFGNCQPKDFIFPTADTSSIHLYIYFFKIPIFSNVCKIFRVRVSTKSLRILVRGIGKILLLDKVLIFVVNFYKFVLQLLKIRKSVRKFKKNAIFQDNVHFTHVIGN